MFLVRRGATKSDMIVLLLITDAPLLVVATGPDPKRPFANSYRPELTLTRQGSCIDGTSRVADVVVWGGGTHNACFGDP